MRAIGLSTLLFLWLIAIPVAARALEVPSINGHMTDPMGKLTGEAKGQIEAQLTKIQEDTHIDVAGWITNVPPDQAQALGRAAFSKWTIGKDWDNGVFMLFPGSGPVYIIQDASKPELTRQEAEQLMKLDVPADPLSQRIDRLATEARRLLIPKTQRQARPWGTNRPRRGLAYLTATLLITFAGTGLSVRRAIRSTPGQASVRRSDETPG